MATAVEMNEQAVKDLLINTSKVIKTYVDKQDEGVKTKVAADLAAVEAKLQNQIDLIAKVDDTDGINTLAERLKAAEEALKNGDALVQVQNRFIAVESAISDLASRIGAVEEGVSLVNGRVDAVKKSVTDLGTKVTSDIATAKSEAVKEAGTYTDTVAEELRKEINGGGEAVIALEKKVDTNKAETDAAIAAVETKAKEYADSLVVREMNLDGILDEIEAIFGVSATTSTNSNAL